VITLGSGFGGTGKTDVAVTLAAIYAAARPADRVILADSNDDMPHGYIRLGGVPVEALPPGQRTLSIRGFYQACTDASIKVYADLRDAVAWLQGVAVIRGDTADECVGIDFGEHEYLTVLEFLQCMSNIVINDGGTGLFSQLQVGTLLHGDKYVFVTEASQLGFWSIDQVFSRYRNYEGEKDRPLTEREKKHLNGLMDEATIVVDKFSENDPEQARWLTRIREGFEGTQVSVVATPWDQALANRVTLDLGAVAGTTLDAKLAMAEVVLFHHVQGLTPGVVAFADELRRAGEQRAVVAELLMDQLVGDQRRRSLGMRGRRWRLLFIRTRGQHRRNQIRCGGQCEKQDH